MTPQDPIQTYLSEVKVDKSIIIAQNKEKHLFSLPKNAWKNKFLSKLNKTENCWLWVGSSKGGYGCFSFNSKNYRAHRISFILTNKIIPFGKQLDHLCKNKLCVNPKHLEPVSNRTNVLRGNAITAKNIKKTHCKRGHKFTKSNTYIRKNEGEIIHRACLFCKNETTKKYNKIRNDACAERNKIRAIVEGARK